MVGERGARGGAEEKRKREGERTVGETWENEPPKPPEPPTKLGRNQPKREAMPSEYANVQMKSSSRVLAKKLES